MKKLEEISVYVPIKKHSVYKVTENGIGEENVYPKEIIPLSKEDLIELFKGLLDKAANEFTEKCICGNIPCICSDKSNRIKQRIINILPKYLKELGLTP